MSRQPVTVCVRIRPTTNPPTHDNNNYLRISDKSVSINIDNTRNVSSHSTSFTLQADHVFSHQSSQEDVFNTAAVPLINSSVAGGANTCILGYGPTGAGKTYTLMGADDDRGVCPRTVSLIFDYVRREVKDVIAVRVSVLEIYNDTLTDLLNNEASSSSRLTLIETVNGVCIPNLFLIPTASEETAMSILIEASRRRIITENAINISSSRSHIIYTLYITRTIIQPSSSSSHLKDDMIPSIVESKIQIVDLAGSERTSEARSERVLLQQTKHINRSLSYLQQVISALASTNRAHVPFRRCKLTHALKDCLAGNCLTLLIACIRPTEDQKWETLSTLKLARRMQSVSTLTEERTAVTCDSRLVSSLRRRVIMLEKELIARDCIAGSEPWMPELTREQEVRTAIHLESILLLGDRDEAMGWQSLSQVNLAIGLLQRALWDSSGGDRDVYAKRVRESFGEYIEANGKDDGSRVPSMPVRCENPRLIAHAVPIACYSPPISIAAAPGSSSLETFKLTDKGRALSEVFEVVKSRIAENKARQKQLIALVNCKKKEIDKVSNDILNVENGKCVIDEKDIKELREMKASLKISYRGMAEELRELKLELETLQCRKQEAMTALLEEFAAAGG